MGNCKAAKTLTPHLLTKVSSSAGASTIIAYGKLSDPALYTKDSGANAAVYPKIDLHSSPPVVASVGYDNGIGGINTVKYTATTDEGGAVIERFAYEPFGKLRTPSGSLDASGAIRGVSVH